VSPVTVAFSLGILWGALLAVVVSLGVHVWRWRGWRRWTLVVAVLGAFGGLFGGLVAAWLS